MASVQTAPLDQSLSEIDVPIESHAGAAFFCERIVGFGVSRPQRILIAGCGEGHEAAAIQQVFDTQVEAVDIEPFFLDKFQDQPGLNFQVGSVCDLPFEDQSFDAIFYHHVIEHVDDPNGSLVEMHRLLAKDGVLFIGTPNRHRVFSSIGAHHQSEWEATIWNKAYDNWRDWSARLRGRFRNEFGAHAGFSRRELDEMAQPFFSRRVWATEDYLKFKYDQSKFRPALSLMRNELLLNVLAPSIYVFCRH